MVDAWLYLQTGTVAVASVCTVVAASKAKYYWSVADKLKSAPVYTVGSSKLSKFLGDADVEPITSYAAVNGLLQPVDTSFMTFVLTNPRGSLSPLNDPTAVQVIRADEAILDTFAKNSGTALMLPTGSVVTVIGQLSLASGGGALQIEPGSSDHPYLITIKSVPQLISEYSTKSTRHWIYSVIFGGITILAIYGLTKKLRLVPKGAIFLRKIRHWLDSRQWGQTIGEGSSWGQQRSKLCVICRRNCREVKVSPCGHLCLCHECSGNPRSYKRGCPLCGQEVVGIILD